MSWSDLGWTFAAVSVLVTGLIALFRLLWELFRLRVAFARCHQCGQRFGRAAALVAVNFWERVYGQGVRVLDGPRSLNGAKVVRCPTCGAEDVFGELGGFVKNFTGGQELPNWK